MRPGWSAGGVRAQAMARRRYGAAAARALAASPSLDVAIQALAGGPYGHDVRPGQTLAEAQHAVAATLLWHLRVLAAWVPRDGVVLLRSVAAGFELANLEAWLRARRQPEPADAVPAFRLGALGTTLGRRIHDQRPPDAVRATLVSSGWGDPGAETDYAIGLHLRLEWARRCAPELPEHWVPGAVAVLVAREHYGAGRAPAGAARRTARLLLGRSALEAPTLEAFRAALPRLAAWALADAGDVGSLWRAESTWRRRVEADSVRELRRGPLDRTALVAACAVLAVDAWRVRAALAAAARGGAVEAFDDVA